MTFSERIPPQSLDAEQAVLGSMLIDKDVIAQVRGKLDAGDFYADRHGVLFKAISALADKRKPVDLLTVQEILRRPSSKGSETTYLQEIGGLEYLTNLINTVPTTANVMEYAKTVRAKADLRRLQDAGRQIVENVTRLDQQGADISEVAAQAKADAEASLRSVTVGTQSGEGLALVRGIADRARETLANQGKVNPNRIEFGLRVLDRFSWLKGEVLALHAASGNGKSTLIRRMLVGAARLGHRAGLFSLEMGRAQIEPCLIAAESELSLGRIRNMDREPLTADQAKKYEQAAERIDSLPLHIDYTPQQKWQEIRAKILSAAMQYGGLDVFAIDYTAIIGETPGSKDRHEQMLVGLHYDAQALAREINALAIMVDQAPTEMLLRANPTPTIFDFAYAKGIPRACDHCIGLVIPTNCVESGQGKARTKPTFPTPGATLTYDDERLSNVLMGAYTKGRFTGPGFLLPFYHHGASGHIGNLVQYPWTAPADKQVPEATGPRVEQMRLVAGDDQVPVDNF